MLNEKICTQCYGKYLTSGDRFDGSSEREKIMFQNCMTVFAMWWKGGECACPATASEGRLMSTLCKPPKNCNYQLEQLMSRQK